MKNFPRPTDELEWMDEPGFGHQGAVDTYRYLSPVNQLFGGIAPFRRFFQRISNNWEPGRAVRILDVGCGTGDVLRALARWGRRAGYALQLHGVDRHAPTIELARERSRNFPEIALEYGDIFALTEKAYDYVLASQFLHHFPDAEIPAILHHLQSLAREGVVINDLLRTPLHYLATWGLTLFTSAVFRHDARLSVRRGFRIAELNALLHAAGFRDYRLERHFLYRFLLILPPKT